jgi:hypothetical protein
MVEQAVARKREYLNVFEVGVDHFENTIMLDSISVHIRSLFPLTKYSYATMAESRISMILKCVLEVYVIGHQKAATVFQECIDIQRPRELRMRNTGPTHYDAHLGFRKFNLE